MRSLMALFLFTGNLYDRFPVLFTIFIILTPNEAERRNYVSNHASHGKGNKGSRRTAD